MFFLTFTARSSNVGPRTDMLIPYKDKRGSIYSKGRTFFFTNDSLFANALIYCTSVKKNLGVQMAVLSHVCIFIYMTQIIGNECMLGLKDKVKGRHKINIYKCNMFYAKLSSDYLDLVI